MNRLGRFESALSLGGALAGLALGAAAGMALERYGVGRMLGDADPYAEEPFGALHGTPYVVRADDGVELHVEVDDGRRAGSPPVTVIFSHGYALNLDSWHFQRRDLAHLGRLVFWDHRSHGRSGRGPGESSTMEQLGRDLGRVIDEMAPDGPVVLVGHSMGGMSVMALAQQRPELFGAKVAGVALIASSAGDLGRVTLGVPGPLGRVAHRAAPGIVSALARRPELIDRSRREGSDLGYLLVKQYAFGSNAPGSLVEFTAEMLAGTPIEVVAEFLPIFGTHDKRAALTALHDVEALIVGAGADLVTPVEHSRQMARLVPSAEYVEALDSGHMVLLERHDLVTRLLADLLRRVGRRGRPRRRQGGEPGARTGGRSSGRQGVAGQ